MSRKPHVLTRAETDAALAELPDWRARLGGLHTVYRAPSSVTAIELVHAIGRAANDLDHHPDLDWRYDHIFLRTRTHSVGGRTTNNDVELALQISALAADAGAEPRPELYRDVLIAVDTAQPGTIHDAWATVLGFEPWGDSDSLADPGSRLPAVWFQETAAPNPNRLHLDVFVEDSTADAVVATSESAGAQRLGNHGRPSFTVVGDTDGNRFCVCTNLEGD
jgi:4a-hydroxytetrahydrobiopterin dehydratase